MNQIIQIKADLLSKAIVWVLGVILFITPLLWFSGVAHSQPRNVTADIIQVITNGSICITNAVPCQQTGSVGIAADGNDSIVEIKVQLIGPIIRL